MNSVTDEVTDESDVMVYPAVAVPIGAAGVAGVAGAAGVAGVAGVAMKGTTIEDSELAALIGAVSVVAAAASDENGLRSVARGLHAVQASIKAHGPACQEQVCASPLLASILHWCMFDCGGSADGTTRLTEASSGVINAACHALCIVVTDNTATMNAVFSASLLARLCELVRRGAVHAAVHQCKSLLFRDKKSEKPESAARGKRKRDDEDDEDDDDEDFACHVVTSACGALWALSALCKKNPRCHRAMVDIGVLPHAVTLLHSSLFKVQYAACMFIRNAVIGAPIVADAVCDVRCAHGLVNLLARGEAALLGPVISGIREIVVGSIPRQLIFVELDCMLHLHGVLVTSTDSAVHALAICAVGTLACGLRLAQDQVCTLMGGKMLRDMLDYMRPAVPVDVQNQIAVALYSIAARNPDNQVYIGEASGVDKLLAFILASKTEYSVKSVEMAVSALISLAVDNPVNQQRIAGFPGVYTGLMNFLTSGVPTIQGVTAGLLRNLCAGRPEIQTALAARGFLVPLVELVTSTNNFVQEQTLAAVFNMLPSNKQLVRSLKGEKHCVRVLLDCTKPGLVSYKIAIMILRVLCEGNDELVASLGSQPAVVSAMLRLSHSSINCERLRSQADSLLRLIAPSVIDSRPAETCLSVLQALVHCTTASECPICMCADDHEPAVFLPCFHSFHLTCITQWLSAGRDSCPLCKSSVLSAVSALIGNAQVAAAAVPHSSLL
jgi:hypothetical protein